MLSQVPVEETVAEIQTRTTVGSWEPLGVRWGWRSPKGWNFSKTKRTSFGSVFLYWFSLSVNLCK